MDQSSLKNRVIQENTLLAHCFKVIKCAVLVEKKQNWQCCYFFLGGGSHKAEDVEKMNILAIDDEREHQKTKQNKIPQKCYF